MEIRAISAFPRCSCKHDSVYPFVIFAVTPAYGLSELSLTVTGPAFMLGSGWLFAVVQRMLGPRDPQNTAAADTDALTWPKQVLHCQNAANHSGGTPSRTCGNRSHSHPHGRRNSEVCSVFLSPVFCQPSVSPAFAATGLATPRGLQAARVQCS